MAGYGTYVRECREAEGLTQEELAERLGTSRGTVGNIEAERVAIDAEMFVRICQELRVLRPTELLNRMGFIVGTSRTATIPPALATALSALGPSDLQTVLRVARALGAQPGGQPPAAGQR